MPANTNEAQAWIYEQEQADRKNSRVVDKIMLALPRELTSEQRYKLAESYAKEITHGRAAYYFAIHEQGKDAHNPHCHLVIRDRDIKTGERVIGFSDNARDWKRRGLGAESATHWIRERWEHHANKALSEAGHSVTIDRRTLEAQREEALKQGDLERARELDRKAQIHIGVQANALQEQGLRPESKGKYCKIDNGKTRPEHNAAIIDLNLEKKIRSQDISTRTRALFEKEQLSKERELEARHRATRTAQEAEERTLRTTHRQTLKELAESRNQGVAHIQAELKANQEKRLQAVQDQQKAERENLNREQGRFLARVRVFVDFTGQSKAKQEQAMQELLNRQQGQEKATREKIEAEQATARETALQAYQDKIQKALDTRDRDLQGLQARHEKETALMQEQLQAQATNREHARLAMEQVIQERERTTKKAQEQDNKPEKTLAEQRSDLQNTFKTSDPKEQARQQRQDRAKEIARQIQEARTAPPQHRKQYELER
jgi:hypothetical protein